MFPQATVSEATTHAVDNGRVLGRCETCRGDREPRIVKGVASNRFFSLATDSDDDRAIVGRSCSDIDNVPTRPRRRLRLR